MTTCKGCGAELFAATGPLVRTKEPSGWRFWCLACGRVKLRELGATDAEIDYAVAAGSAS